MNSIAPDTYMAKTNYRQTAWLGYAKVFWIDVLIVTSNRGCYGNDIKVCFAKGR